MSTIRGIGSGGGAVEDLQPFPSGSASGAPPELKGVPGSPLNPAVGSLVSSYRSQQSGGAVESGALERRYPSFPQIRAQYFAATAKLENAIADLQTYVAYCERQLRGLEADRKAGRPLPEGIESQPWHWQVQIEVSRAEIQELKDQQSNLRDHYLVNVGLSKQTYLEAMRPEDVERLKDAAIQFENAFDKYNRAVDGLKASGVLAVGSSAAMIVNQLRGKPSAFSASADVLDIAGKSNNFVDEGVKHGVQNRPVVTWGK